MLTLFLLTDKSRLLQEFLAEKSEKKVKASNKRACTCVYRGTPWKRKKTLTKRKQYSRFREVGSPRTDTRLLLLLLVHFRSLYYEARFGNIV